MSDSQLNVTLTNDQPPPYYPDNIPLEPHESFSSALIPPVPQNQQPSSKQPTLTNQARSGQQPSQIASESSVLVVPTTESSSATDCCECAALGFFCCCYCWQNDHPAHSDCCKADCDASDCCKNDCCDCCSDLTKDCCSEDCWAKCCRDMFDSDSCGEIIALIILGILCCPIALPLFLCYAFFSNN